MKEKYARLLAEETAEHLELEKVGMERDILKRDVVENQAKSKVSLRERGGQASLSFLTPSPPPSPPPLPGDVEGDELPPGWNTAEDPETDMRYFYKSDGSDSLWTLPSASDKILEAFYLTKHVK